MWKILFKHYLFSWKHNLSLLGKPVTLEPSPYFRVASLVLVYSYSELLLESYLGIEFGQTEPDLEQESVVRSQTVGEPVSKSK
jgi:hypothetical protein